MVCFKEVAMSTSHLKEWQIVCREIGLLTAQAVQGRLETAGIPIELNAEKLLAN
jgi:hypothetical protein